MKAFLVFLKIYFIFIHWILSSNENKQTTTTHNMSESLKVLVTHSNVCVCVCVCVCVVGWWLFPIPRRNSLTPQINSVLTCLCWDSIRSHRLRGHSFRTALPLQVPVSSPDCHLYFWPTCYQWETAINPSPGLFNLLNWLTELRETFYLQDHCLCSVARSCLTPCNPIDCSPPGPSIHGVF